jgi:hypothetical protein
LIVLLFYDAYKQIEHICLLLFDISKRKTSVLQFIVHRQKTIDSPALRCWLV